ncbi:hypothetical protein G6F68_021045 [Rhizopus microsporus]|uniref:Uncharacterized protein n=1 Tax=Rhizopus delemar TaxID=936053 RepID=A0A9P6XRX0_9FUNG|nr:hypothetical protein G6F68_021045 [Rhizopus microsporus]KAG1470606.1 hypothetical protein G6F54_014527 [Rhizopus delemar]KAG1531092.1 hypothetical protein G6F50_016903 [Rhizopus delemar]
MLEQAGGPAVQPDDLRVVEVVTDAGQMVLVIQRRASALQMRLHGGLAQRQQEGQIVVGGGLQRQGVGRGHGAMEKAGWHSADLPAA